MFYVVSQNTPLRKLPALPFSAVGWSPHQPQRRRERGVFAEREPMGRINFTYYDRGKTAAFLCVTPYLCPSVLKNTTVSQLGKNIQLIF